MRLLTFSADDEPRLGAEWNGIVVDLQNAVALRELLRGGLDAARWIDFPSTADEYLSGGEETASAAREALAFLDGVPSDVLRALTGAGALLYREDQIRRHAPVPKPGKIICLGLNYRDHAAESNMPVPQEPVIFCKYPSAVIGTGDAIVLPPDSEEVDYEAELVFVIGRTCRNVSEEAAMACVAGYTCGHDVSARDYQLKRGGGQWTIGKTWDTFAPMGPVLVTADEGLDPHNLRIQCRVNGKTLQDSNTNQFVFNIPQTIAYLSRVMTLEPGDCVFTGTPPGVGFARKPQVLLKPGDLTEIEIEGIGVLANPVAAAG